MKANRALNCEWKMQNKDLSTEGLLAIFIVSPVLDYQHTGSLRRELPHLISGKKFNPQV